MIASPAATLPAGREWIYEARVQGQRVLIYKDGPSISIRARGEPDLESRYPEVTLAAAAIREERAVLDSPMLEAVRTAQEIGLSGVVAKRVDSAYHSGVAHGEWLELRFRRAELFVIGGYVPAGSESVDALLVGTLALGKLRYSAQVHEGVVGRVRTRLRQALEPLKIDQCPFVDLPAEVESAVWVHPEANALIGYIDRIDQWRVSVPRLMYFADDAADERPRRASLFPFTQRVCGSRKGRDTIGGVILTQRRDSHADRQAGCLAQAASQDQWMDACGREQAHRHSAIHAVQDRERPGLADL